MTIMRPWTRRVLDLIDEGVHDRAELIRLATPFVPEGHAYRKREQVNAQVRRDSARRRGGEVAQPRKLERSAREIHSSGARTVLRETLNNLVKIGHLVREGDNFYRAAQGSGRSPVSSGSDGNPVTPLLQDQLPREVRRGGRAV